MKVAEPEPGRILTESNTGSSLVTTYTVSPQGGASLVQISTAWKAASGIGGLFERIFAPRVMRAIYADELNRLDAYAREIGDGTTREALDHASFADLVQAKFGPAGEFEATRKAFITRFGPIVFSRFGKNIPCGVALTDGAAADDRTAAAPPRPERSGHGIRWRGVPRSERRRRRREQRLRLSEQCRPVRLHLFLPMLTPTTAQAIRTLSKCQEKAVYARRFLQDDDLRQCLTLLYWPADALIARADAGAAAPGTEKPAGNTPESAQPANTATGHEPAKNDISADQFFNVVEEQLDVAEQYYQHFTQRTVRSAYFRGIGYGMVAVVGLFVVLYVFRRALNAPVALLWSIVAGGLGALTSVLSSATFGRIILDRSQGGTWNTFLGAFRPIIGSLFGVAFFVLIYAGFLPIKVPNGNGMIALYASVAFLAGFSQRWAQDTLKAAQDRVPAPLSPSGGTPEQGTAIKPTRQKA